MDMKGELSSAGLYTDFSGLARLRSEASQKSPEANREVAQQFEALFLQSMIKAMRDASQLSDSTDGEQTRFYQEMFDKQIALDLSRTGSLGLANALEQQFNGVSNLQLNNRGGNYSSVNGVAAVTATRNQPSQAVASWAPATPEDLTPELWPHA
ncbi:MAG: rod-binding protein, partial [Gammaproteobacteria bacterium]